MLDLELKNIKGTFDSLPKEQIVKNEIIDKLKEVFSCYGYLPLESSTLCSYDLLASKYAGGAEILKEVVRLYQNGEKKADVACAGQNAVANGLAELSIAAADKKGIQNIGATGGVFYNEAITNAIKNHVEKEGYNFIQHINTCAGDGSVSLGQAIISKKI